MSLLHDNFSNFPNIWNNIMAITFRSDLGRKRDLTEVAEPQLCCGWISFVFVVCQCHYCDNCQCHSHRVPSTTSVNVSIYLLLLYKFLYPHLISNAPKDVGTKYLPTSTGRVLWINPPGPGEHLGFCPGNLSEGRRMWHAPPIIATPISVISICYTVLYNVRNNAIM